MNKELIDRVWRCLPREFKEEVKKLYTDALDASNSPHEPDDRKWGNYRVTLLEKLFIGLFGRHNLTSDAEGEEMLTVSRKRVQGMYKNNCDEIRRENISSSDKDCYEYANEVLKTLFGSKCLPEPSKLQASCRQVNVDSSHDNVDSSHGNVDSLEPKPAEPKYHKDDKVLYNGAVHKITVGYGDGRYLLNNTQKVVKESDLEPYTEPEKEVVKMRLTTSKVSVYLATKEEDEEFRLLLHENGFRWISGDPLINNAYWNSYTEESKIYYFYPDKTVTYWGDKTSETLTFSEFKKQFFEEKPRKKPQIAIIPFPTVSTSPQWPCKPYSPMPTG